MEYFRYFAWTFETRNDVVSIRRWSSPAQPPAQHQHHYHHHQGNVQQNVNTLVTKYDKYEESAWFHTDVLSIEDPFETGYDVAHVLRAAQMSYLRKEFLVNTDTIYCSFVEYTQVSDAMHSTVSLFCFVLL